MQRRPRIHLPDHLAFIRTLPCLVSGDDTSTEATHIRFSDLTVGKRQTGKAEKPDDIWTVPLSSEQHRRQHTMKEAHFWYEARIDPIKVALALYAVSGDYERGLEIVKAQHALLTD